MAGRHILDRDVFPRRATVEHTPSSDDEIGLAEVSVYKLIEALDRVLKTIEPEFQHEVMRERLTVSDAIHRLADRLRLHGRVSFFALFQGHRRRGEVIVTFLALLEMCKLRLIRVFQEEGEGDIVIASKGEALQNLSAATEVDESEYR